MSFQYLLRYINFEVFQTEKINIKISETEFNVTVISRFFLEYVFLDFVKLQNKLIFDKIFYTDTSCTTSIISFMKEINGSSCLIKWPEN